MKMRKYEFQMSIIQKRTHNIPDQCLLSFLYTYLIYYRRVYFTYIHLGGLYSRKTILLPVMTHHTRTYIYIYILV